jgi:hypothetical protein
MWSSRWIRTIFFNSTQPDEQNSKPSPRARTPELAQGSGSDRIACPVQFVGQIWSFNPRVDHSTRMSIHTTVSSWALERTKILVRFNPSNKNPNPINPLGQEPEPDQSARTEEICPTLPKPRIGRPSSGSTQLDDHSICYILFIINIVWIHL